MCGILFVKQQGHEISQRSFARALNDQRWRGPDAQKIVIENDGIALLGHNRLAIIDPSTRSDQPMRSNCGRYLIIFNGEIYNHLSLRLGLNHNFITKSDTETILVGYLKYGKDFIKKLEGMFAFVIYDTQTMDWVAARDQFGIKPLFIHRSNSFVVLSSEPKSISTLVPSEICELAIQEWRLIRRPIPGHTFFKGINEILPGMIIDSRGTHDFFRIPPRSDRDIGHEDFFHAMQEAVEAHQMSDVENVALLSGGIDSAIICGLSKVTRTYSVGLNENNEFLEAQESANILKKNLIKCSVSPDKLFENWRHLISLRGEPLSLPNEGLIYEVCRQMAPGEKVVLTGEGADEFLFGYDNIFRWSLKNERFRPQDFLSRYGYSNTTKPTDRLIEYVEILSENKSANEFTEDFFIDLHLTGLLRRMDFASMAASKEARVPIVSRQLFELSYRLSPDKKINQNESKIPFRSIARKLGLEGALNRRKIGFNAQLNKASSIKADYAIFQNFVLKELGWL